MWPFQVVWLVEKNVQRVVRYKKARINNKRGGKEELQVRETDKNTRKTKAIHWCEM